MELYYKAVHARVFIGLLCITLGLTILIFHPQDSISKNFRIIYESGRSFEIWSSSNSYDAFINAYAFNITNADAFLQGREKLKMEEVGPFVYREVMRQEEPEFDHEKGTIFSHPRYRLQWEPDLNTLSEDTPLMLPNIAMLFIGNKIASEYWLLQNSLNAFIRLSSSQPIMKQTWKEFAFGFETPFSKFGNTLFPMWINFKKAGIYDRIYDHDGDTSTTFSGEKNFSLAGLIESYNGYPYLKHWDAPCNKLLGSTTGPKLGNNLLANETVYFYRKAVCRALPFEPVKDSTSNNFGVPSVLYKIRENALDNGATNPENKCFCRNNNCLPVGLSDLTDCFYGFSVALSYPHFSKGDPSLFARIDGLKPDVASHDSYLFVNQAIGSLTNASIKLQVNGVLGDMSGIKNCDKFSHMVLPLTWAEFSVPGIPLGLKLGLLTLERLLPIGEIILSFVLLLLGTFLVAYNWQSFLNTNVNCTHDLTQRSCACVADKQSRNLLNKCTTRIVIPCRLVQNFDLGSQRDDHQLDENL